MNILPCPIDAPFGASEVYIVEASCGHFENAIAIECASCGLRSPMADADDGEEMAIKFWNEMVGVLEEGGYK